jgi:DNA-nicking Smr family endonuclease
MSDLTEFEQYCKNNLVIPIKNNRQKICTKSSGLIKKIPVNFNVKAKVNSTLLKQCIHYYDLESPDCFCNNGQNALMRQLAGAKFDIDIILDFHGYTANQAISILEQTITNNHNRIIIRIIHGKGINSINNHPVLKHIVRRFLIRHPRLLAYSTANMALGGSGATCCCFCALK